MSAEANIALIQTVYAAFGRGDVPAILEHLADDVDWGLDTQATPEVPWHGTGKGKKVAAKFFEALGKEAVFTRFEPSGFLASDSAVACLVSWDATLNRNRRTMTQNVMHYFTIKNGRITKWRGMEDTALTKAAWNS
jgi:ketosteroid isomerase-like protein